jgi:hypothetical protein
MSKQAKIEKRLSGMDCRNPEARDGFYCLHPCSLVTGNPCRYDELGK